MGLVSGAEVANEEVGEDGARSVEGSGVGFVLRVPFILALSEGFRRVCGAKGKMSFCVVGFAFCCTNEPLRTIDRDRGRARAPIPSANMLPAT